MESEIMTPAEFTEQQLKALETLDIKREQQYLPSNADLLKILENWPDKICIEILSQQQPLIVEVVKKDFLGEIKRNWRMDDNSPLSISCCSYNAGVLVLTLI